MTLNVICLKCRQGVFLGDYIEDVFKVNPYGDDRKATLAERFITKHMGCSDEGLVIDCDALDLISDKHDDVLMLYPEGTFAASESEIFVD